jgi:hypothetical protein
MKKLITSALVVSAITFFSATASATTPDRPGHGEHRAWATFHTVADTYFNATGTFQNLSESEKAQFFTAAESIKQRLENSDRPGASELLKKIDLTENVFRFVWSSKPEFTEIDLNMEIPAAPVVL